MLYQFCPTAGVGDFDRDILAEHREIAEHTPARDEEGAASVRTRHVERTTDLLVAHLNREAAESEWR